MHNAISTGLACETSPLRIEYFLDDIVSQMGLSDIAIIHAIRMRHDGFILSHVERQRVKAIFYTLL